MTFEEKIAQYAKLAVQVGVNVQKGQEVLVQCPVECAFFARAVAEASFEAGAKDVIVHYADDLLQRIRLEHASMETLTDIPPWKADSHNYYAKRDSVFLMVSSSDPTVLEGVNPQKIAAQRKASRQATKPTVDARMSGAMRWNICAVPSLGWAQKVFPDCPPEEAMQKLWDAIFTAVRIGEGDPISHWKQHQQKLDERTEYLNRMQFDALHYTNSLGTDLTVGLPEGHRWRGGGEYGPTGVFFVPNMPTEEVFTLPHKDRVSGKLVSALPLNYSGSLIDGFAFTFQEGKIVDFSAKTGYETLKALLETDEGAKRLGEVALIPYHSRISNLKILFYNTLFDENASCHLALGDSYTDCLQNHEQMTEEEIRRSGANQSLIHVDFMIGTSDLTVTGISKDGKETLLFQNGDWSPSAK